MRYSDERILELINEACAIVDNNGSYDGAKELHLNLLKNLLLEGLDTPQHNNIKKYSSEKFLFSIIHKAIVSVKNSSDQRKRSVYNRAIRFEFEGLKKKGFRFLYFVNIRLPESNPIMHFNIGGNSVDWMSHSTFLKSNYIFSEFDNITNEAFNNIYNKKHVNYNNYSMVSIYINGYDLTYCVEKAIEIYEKFLGLLNLSLHLNSNSMRFGLYQRCSYSDLTGMNICYIYKRNKFLNQMTIIQYSNADPINFNERHFDKLYNIYNIIIKFNKKFDLYSDIQTFLFLYQKAMKSPEIDIRFLYFWEIIELFLKKEITDNYDQIINRAKWIFNNEWLIEENLKLIKNKRNSLVHGKNTDVGIEDIHHIQFFSESVFKFFIFSKRRLEAKPFIFELFDMKNIDKENLRLKKEVMNYIFKEST